MEQHHTREHISFGQRIADKVVAVIGSWAFIITQSVFIITWIIINGFVLKKDGWDVYPFILLNLMLSFQAAYTGPVVMMSQNRMEEKDRARAQRDLATDMKAEREIEEIQVQLDRLEKKLDTLLKVKEGYFEVKH
jgi:uncharacterized membrane protein